ncbi:major facilitator superfamily protein [Bisporella sp. PMI_857]|nr:major facilitator superfamily protein [Bisporella sp. PMI_857]
MNETKEDTSDDPSVKIRETPSKSLGFWAIIASLAFSGLLTALEATITSTALPTIIEALGGADLYIWVINIYFLTTTAFQPLYGQLADVFGRRYLSVIAVALFLLGSGVCGGSSSVAMLIAGRGIQGMGAGGINVLIEIILCDLVPLRERGKYFGMIFGFIAIGTAAGPVFGGLIVQHTTWRWVFYLNLPVGGLALLLLIVFLHVNYRKDMTMSQKLKRVDWVGNFIFVASIVSVLTATAWGGAIYSWGSYRVLVPLIIGLLGLVAFIGYETSKFCIEPTMPPHLFTNRTSAIAFILTFLHSIVTIWALYFLPVYFQGVLASTTGHSGVQLLPTVLFLVPAAIIAGGTLSKFGRYRPLHHAGFAIMTIGFGLFTLFNKNSSTAVWVIFQGIEALGSGLVLPVLLPAVQAQLTEADTALATSTWAFMRSFGMIFGATIPAAIFNNRFDELASGISDQVIATSLKGGKAYQHATENFLNALPDNVRSEIVEVMSDSLKRTWQVAVGIAGFGFLMIILEKEVQLRKELNTEFGMAEAKEESVEEP